MYLYGASGHAKVIIDILSSKNEEIQGIYDDDVLKKEISGYEISLVPKDIELLEGAFIISIGDNKTRMKLSEKFKLKYSSATHLSAVISNSVSIGNGTVVMASAVINASTVIGNHVIINTSASIDHDCIVGDYAHISPTACLCGGVEVGMGTHIGAGATILPGVKIGKWCTIGAGSVVLNDIGDNSIVVGNPAHKIRDKKK